MELKERQRSEKNRATLILGLLILGYSTLIALLGFADVTANMAVVTPRAIASVLVFAAFLFSYFRYRQDRKFEISCLVCMFASYGITILTQRNTYMYALSVDAFLISPLTFLFCNNPCFNFFTIYFLFLFYSIMATLP